MLNILEEIIMDMVQNEGLRFGFYDEFTDFKLDHYIEENDDYLCICFYHNKAKPVLVSKDKVKSKQREIKLKDLGV
jgi:hypothetical protein